MYVLMYACMCVGMYVSLYVSMYVSMCVCIYHTFEKRGGHTPYTQEDFVANSQLAFFLGEKARITFLLWQRMAGASGSELEILSEVISAYAAMRNTTNKVQQASAFHALQDLLVKESETQKDFEDLYADLQKQFESHHASVKMKKRLDFWTMSDAMRLLSSAKQQARERITRGGGRWQGNTSLGEDSNVSQTSETSHNASASTAFSLDTMD